MTNPSGIYRSDDELIAFLALLLIPQVGAVTIRNVVSYCGGVNEVFQTSRKELMKIPGIGPAMADTIIQKSDWKLAEEEFLFTQNNHIQIITYLDATYPERLKPWNDAPAVLFYKGNGKLNHPRTLAVIGTRMPSPQGKQICQELIAALAPYDVQVISGMAWGIDGVAHQACVKNQMTTIGILAHGLHRIYPADHVALAKEMLEKGGLLTEFPVKSKFNKENFPMRNRVIAMLSDAVLVVETGQSGGSIITADMATRYCKDVFAIPGRVTDTTSKGCNWLIKSNRAGLVESAQDIIDQMNWQIQDNPVIQTQLFVELSSEEQKIMDILNVTSPIHVDQLMMQSGLTTGKLASLLLDMELKGVVHSLPGKRYSK